MKNKSDSKNDVIKFLVEKNERVQRKEIVVHVGSVSTDQALRKIIDLDDEMKELVTISDMNEKDQYTKQKKIGYTLNKDIETFRKVFFYFYGSRNRWKLLRTPYFNDILPELINNFTSRMEHLKLDPLTPVERDFILDRIKYPSVLRAVLSADIDIEKMVLFLKKERDGINYVGEKFFPNNFKEQKNNPVKKGTFEEWNNSAMGNLTPIMYVFEFLMQHDRLDISAQQNNAKLLKIDAEYQTLIRKKLFEFFEKL